MWADLEASSPAGLSGLTLEAAEINPTLHMGVWCPSPMLPAHAHNPSVPQGDGPRPQPERAPGGRTSTSPISNISTPRPENKNLVLQKGRPFTQQVALKQKGDVW